MTGNWVTTADHKQVGRLFILFALAFLVATGIIGGLLRAELDVSDEGYLKLLDLHATGAATLVLAPLWLGLATFAVPLQIGAARLAMPRLQTFALWSFVFGGVLHVASYTGDGPQVAGVSFSTFTLTGAGDKGHTDLWVASLLLVTVALALCAANLVATVLAHRTEGMTLARVPMFTWATLVSGIGFLIASAVFVAGLLLLFLDQHYGGHDFFGPGTIGTQVIWQHMLWLYGRPDLYLLLVPGLGAACDIVAKSARRPLVDTRAARYALAAVAVFGFGSWAAGTKVADAIVLPTYSPLTAAVVLPIGALVLLWLDTLRRADRLSGSAALGFVGAFVVALGGGAIAAVIAGVNEVEGTAWSSGHAHLVAFGAPLLLAVGAIHHWSPKLFGRALPVSAAGVHTLLLLGGTAIFAMGQYLAGWDAQDRGVNITGDGFGRITMAGGVILLLGAIAVFVTVVARMVQPVDAVDAADDGLTLEWATASPPPAHNFDTVPEVRSDTPVTDLAEASA